MLDVPVRNQQLHAHVLAGEVIRGVVGDFPHKLEPLLVGDELSAKVRSPPFWSILDMKTLPDFRHRTRHNAPSCLSFDSFPIAISARARPTWTRVPICNFRGRVVY